MTIEHADPQIGVLEEDNLIAIGLAGAAFGEWAEVSLQFNTKPDQQDRQLGLDGLYIDYNQLGGYGVVNIGFERNDDRNRTGVGGAEDRDRRQHPQADMGSRKNVIKEKRSRLLCEAVPGLRRACS